MKKGISLIVLVITIIVMIILAAAVVISMSNNGIIEKASNAVNLTDEKQVQDLAALAWAEAYLDETRTDTIEKVVKDKLAESGVTDVNWNIEVSDSGVIVSKKDSSNSVVENKLSGKWQLKETLTQTGWASGDEIKIQNINYTISYNGGTPIDKSVISYGMMEMGINGVCYYISNTELHQNAIYHYTVRVGCPYTQGLSSPPVILDFGSTPQEVDADFYAWFTSNAIKQ